MFRKMENLFCIIAFCSLFIACGDKGQKNEKIAEIDKVEQPGKPDKPDKPDKPKVKNKEISFSFSFDKSSPDDLYEGIVDINKNVYLKKVPSKILGEILVKNVGISLFSGAFTAEKCEDVRKHNGYSELYYFMKTSSTYFSLQGNHLEAPIFNTLAFNDNLKKEAAQIYNKYYEKNIQWQELNMPYISNKIPHERIKVKLERIIEKTIMDHREFAPQRFEEMKRKLQEIIYNNYNLPFVLLFSDVTDLACDLFLENVKLSAEIEGELGNKEKGHYFPFKTEIEFNKVVTKEN